MKELRMGVIGLGYIGSLHTRIIAENPCAILAAVADVNGETAEKFGAEYGCRAYADYEEMLKNEELDAVSVCVPEDYHVAPAVAAANAGVNLFLEKPIAKTAAEALEIKDACEKNGVRLMVGHVLKLDPRYVQLHDSVKAGELGEISQIFVKRQNPKSVAARFRGRVSFFYYLGVHDIEWMLSYANGNKPVRVYAQRNNVINGAVDDFDTTFVIVNFDNGALGCVCLGWSLPDNDAVGILSSVELIGSKGMGAIDTRNSGLEIITDNVAKYPDTLLWPEYNGKIQGDLKAEVDHFIQSTINDEPYFVDTDNAIDAVKIVEAAFKSIETGLPVEL